MKPSPVRKTIRATLVTLALCLLAAVPSIPAQTGGSGRFREESASYTAAASRFAALVRFDNAATAPRPGSGTPGGGPPYDLATLSDLIERTNPAIAVGRSAEESARGDLNSARAQRYPSLRAESSGAYLGNPQDAIVIPAYAFAELNILNPAIPLIPAVDPFQYSFKLIGELPLFTWGKTGLGIQASEAALGAARLQLAKNLQEKRIQLEATWEALACVVAAEEALALQAEAGIRLAALAEQNQRSGFITPVELLEVRLKVKQGDVARARLAENRERLLSKLATLSGLESLSLDQLNLKVPVAGTVPEEEAVARTNIPAGNYDLALARAQVEARSSLEALARTQAKGLPDLGLRAELSFGGSRLPYASGDWEDKTDWQLILSIGASGRLFGDPVKAGAAQRAKAELDQARFQLEEGRRQLGAYIRESYLNLDLLRSRLEYSLLQQEYWAASLSRQQAILDLGAGSETDYLGILMEALGGLAEGYGLLAEYRAVILGLKGAAGGTSF